MVGLQLLGDPIITQAALPSHVGLAAIYPPPSKELLPQNNPEELFLGRLRQYRIISYAKELSENYFPGSYINFA